MQRLLLLAVALSCWSPVHLDVVQRFQDLPSCLDFFYRRQPPSGFVGTSQVHLCQRLAGTVYYASLFDPSGRLPIFSAFLYKYRAPGVLRGSGVERRWKYEPQLTDPRGDGNMAAVSAEVERNAAVRRSQAVSGDYPSRAGQRSSAYVRVMLNPVELQGSRESRSATHTVTNAVPAPRPFYQRGWKPALRTVQAGIRRQCPASPVYLVSGAVRGPRRREDWVPRTGKGRAAVPHLLWLTYCCGNGASGAVLGNTGASGNLTLDGTHLPPHQTTTLTLTQLEEFLTARLGRRVHIYSGGCTPL